MGQNFAKIDWHYDQGASSAPNMHSPTAKIEKGPTGELCPPFGIKAKTIIQERARVEINKKTSWG